MNIDFNIVTKNPFYEEPEDPEFEYESSEIDGLLRYHFIYDLDYIDTFDDIEIIISIFKYLESEQSYVPCPSNYFNQYLSD